MFDASQRKVIYIDTDSTFRPERLRPICERFNLDYNAALENIYYFRAHTSEMQVLLFSLFS